MTETTYVNGRRADAEALRASARATVRQALDEGREISTDDLATAFGRSRRWAQDRVAEVRAERAREGEQRSAAQDGRSVDEPERSAAQDPTLREVAAVLRRTMATRALARLTRDRTAGRAPMSVAVLAAVIVAVGIASGSVISYVELAALADAAGFTGWLRWLYPLVVDTLLMTGLLIAWVRAQRGEPAGIRPVLALIVGGGATIAGNVAARHFAVGTPNAVPLWVWIPPLMAGYVPVALALAFEQALALFRDARPERGREEQ